MLLIRWLFSNVWFVRDAMLCHRSTNFAMHSAQSIREWLSEGFRHKDQNLDSLDSIKYCPFQHCSRIRRSLHSPMNQIGHIVHHPSCQWVRTSTPRTSILIVRHKHAIVRPVFWMETLTKSKCQFFRKFPINSCSITLILIVGTEPLIQLFFFFVITTVIYGLSIWPSRCS